ncbi:PqqD family protein [Streptomyces sp. NPDC050315]|uniref:PqqD family protein n=1 Tax=Streptomyces sp. NPDC050315 TaxID=3155039 RepID=UPI003426B18B
MSDLRPASTVHATITERGAMLLDIRGRGRWYALTAPGALWWRHVAEGTTIDEAADAVATHYGADPDQVRADMRTLTQELYDRGLLRTPGRRRWRR